ncbi:very short patch repair endonuclease [Burkholderia sp. LMG 32019]|uniref:very short patch repair endonuclease n=1 Tax=Burkholderia sp. LMG 32019 TaxID=3158173 RepID=UPI003C2D8944
MTDVFSPEKRSAVMAAIRSENTKPEIAVRSALHRLGYRFRLHVNSLPGRPDILLPRHSIAIQVRGCFWHGHSCADGRLPNSRPEYWLPKLAGNKARDRRNDRKLRALGWSVIVVWECQTNTGRKLTSTVARIERLVQRRSEKACVKESPRSH